MQYFLFLFAFHFTRMLPMRLAYAFAVLIADFHYTFSTIDRRAVEVNLKIALGVDHVSPSLVREVFRNFGKYLVEFFSMSKRFDRAFIKDHLHVRGIENLNEALKQGKGCIIVSAHYGNWEVAGGLLSQLGYPLSVVALPHKDARVNKLFNDQREFFGSTVIPTNTAIRRCMEHLKDNRFVALLSERDFGQSGILMDFLGKPTMIPKGAALFSIKTGAPIVTCFFLRNENDDFEVSFSEPSYATSIEGKITDEDLKPVMSKYIRVIESEIRRNPTQWLMFREFWAT